MTVKVEICPPWWDHFEEELTKTKPDFGKYCAMLTSEELETRKKYVIFKNNLIERFNLDKDFVRVNAPLGAVRSLLKFDPSSEIGKKGAEEIGKILKDNKSVKKFHVEAIIGYKKRATVLKRAIDPETLRIPVKPQIVLVNAPTNKRRELLNQFYKVAGNSIKVYQDLAARYILEDEYASFIMGVSIIEKYLKGELVENV